MTGVIVDIELLLNDVTHAGACPEGCLVTEGFRPLLERGHQFLQLSLVQLWLTSGAARLP